MGKCMKCGKSTLVKGHVKLADGAICTPCFLKLGFKLGDVTTSSIYKFNDIKDGLAAYQANRIKEHMKKDIIENSSDLIHFTNYGQQRDLICTEQEREIFDIIRSLVDDDGLDSDKLELIRKSDNYVSVVMQSEEYGPMDVARIKFTNRAKWIWTMDTDKVKISDPEDVTQYAEAFCNGYRFNEQYL